MAKKKKTDDEEFQEGVNATWGELDKLSELAASYGYNFTGTEIAAWGDVRWGNLKEYLDALDRGDEVATPEWLTELVDAQAGAAVAPVVEAAHAEPIPEPPAAPSEIENLQRQIANLQRQIEYMPLLTPRQQEALEVAEEVGTLSQAVARAEEKYDDADKASKAAKKAYESLLKDLQDAAQRLDDITGTGDYQRSLFNQPYRGVSHDVVAVYEPPKPVDVGAAVSLDDLTKAGLTTHVEHDKPGLTTKKIEALKAEAGGTIGHLEAWLQSNALNTIKGFGEEWVTRTMDALGVIRDRYPVPIVDEPTADELLTADAIAGSVAIEIEDELDDDNAIIEAGELVEV